MDTMFFLKMKKIRKLLWISVGEMPVIKGVPWWLNVTLPSCVQATTKQMCIIFYSSVISMYFKTYFSKPKFPTIKIHPNRLGVVMRTVS
uniref:Uncharacterized protein n=1 Tax=Anguilla anguilla TaxID=7936 RepID=A0A0E9XY73_ANGAN